MRLITFVLIPCPGCYNLKDSLHHLAHIKLLTNTLVPTEHEYEPYPLNLDSL